MAIRIYADFQKLDDYGRAILTCVGTQRDLEVNNVSLHEGMHVVLYSDDYDDYDDYGAADDIEVDAIIDYDPICSRWVAKYDASAFRHSSDIQ